ncbi:MAG: SdrD B-like domain-containing protein, partial [Caldisericota bacterium]|nr:SdrD B-like domain-containing protein [Caldisericota bacterium]
MKTKKGWLFTLSLFLLVFLLVFNLGFVGLSRIYAVSATTTLELTKGSWDIIGLDSNKVADGPNQFLIQVHIANTGGETATNVAAQLILGSGSAFITSTDLGPKTINTIDVGSAIDVFFLVDVQRTDLAYYTTKDYTVTVSGTNVSSATISGTLIVKKLISQNRNSVDSITPSTPLPKIDQIFTVTVISTTSTFNYPHIEVPIVGYDPTIVQPIGVSTTYDSSSSNDLLLHNAGGNPMTSTWTFKAIALGSTSLGSFIYDQTKDSGENFHYNDYTTGPTIVVEGYSISGMKFNDIDNNGVKDTGEPGLSGWTINLKDSTGAIIKTEITDGNGNYSFTDLLPGTYNVSEVAQPGWTQTYPASGYYDVTISDADATDINFGNTITTDADIYVYKICHDITPGDIGVLAYTITVGNYGPSDALNFVLTDTLPAGLSNATYAVDGGSQVSWTGSHSFGTIASGVSHIVTIYADVSSSLTTIDPNTAIVTSDTPDAQVANNSDTCTNTITTDADIYVYKICHDITPGDIGVLAYTITVGNYGPSDALN